MDSLFKNLRKYSDDFFKLFFIWSLLSVWALYSYNYYYWLLPFHITIVYMISKQNKVSFYLKPFYCLLIAVQFYFLFAMVWPLGPQHFISPILLGIALIHSIKLNHRLNYLILAPSVFFLFKTQSIFISTVELIFMFTIFIGYKNSIRFKTWVSPLSLLFTILPLIWSSRLLQFYFISENNSFTINKVDSRVEVLYSLNELPEFGVNPRFFLDSCDNKFWLIGTAFKPMIIKIHKENKSVLKSKLEGKVTDSIIKDCKNGFIFGGINNKGIFYLIDEKSLKTKWISSSLSKQISYATWFPKLNLAVFGEDVGFHLWKINLKNLNKPQIQEASIPTYDLSSISNHLLVASKGSLRVYSPKSLKLREIVLLPSPIQPQLSTGYTSNKLFVSNILFGLIHQYTLNPLRYTQTLFGGLGVRYLYYHKPTDKLATLNYFSGYLTILDSKSGQTIKRYFVGPKGRVITESNDGKWLYFVTNIGFIRVSKNELFYTR